MRCLKKGKATRNGRTSKTGKFTLILKLLNSEKSLTGTMKTSAALSLLPTYTA